MSGLSATRPIASRGVRRGVLPGFGLSLGVTVAMLGSFVVVPISALAAKAAGLSGQQLSATLLDTRVLRAVGLSVGAALAAAVVDGVLGFLIAWVLARYQFLGRRIIDALIDLPFALPTAVAGIVLTALYAKNGWLGRYLEPLGIQVAFTRIGIVVALVFIGLPFVVRTLQPVLSDLDAEVEEAAASLGADRWTVFRRVIFPALWPSMLTGIALAFARGVGEYGSVVFISGNMPNKTEIAPLLIMSKLEQYDYAGASAIALLMLAISLVLLIAINLLQRWSSRTAAD